MGLKKRTYSTVSTGQSWKFLSVSIINFDEQITRKEILMKKIMFGLILLSGTSVFAAEVCTVTNNGCFQAVCTNKEDEVLPRICRSSYGDAAAASSENMMIKVMLEKGYALNARVGSNWFTFTKL